jgi:hypothetical protein
MTPIQERRDPAINSGGDDAASVLARAEYYTMKRIFRRWIYVPGEGWADNQMDSVRPDRHWEEV